MHSEKREVVSFMASPHPPLPRRIVLKVKRVLRELSPAEREFLRLRPLIASIEGFLLDGQDRWLFKTARCLPRDANIVEIGSFKGRSTCCLAFGCQGSRKRVFAVDRFDGGPDLPRQDSFPEFSQNIARCGLSEYVEPIVGISVEVAKTWNKPIHLLFIDGSHRYEDVLGDFAGFFPHVVSGGIVAVHDVCEGWPGVLRAWHESIKHQLRDIGDCETLGYGRKAEIANP